MLNEVVEKLSKIIQAASLINTTIDNQLLDYCIYFNFGFFETTWIIYETQPIYLVFHWKSHLEKPTQNTEPSLLAIFFAQVYPSIF